MCISIHVVAFYSNKLWKHWNTFGVPKNPLQNIHCVKCPNTEFFLVRFFRLNAGQYGPEKTPHLDTFHAVILRPACQIELSRSFMEILIANLNHFSSALAKFLFYGREI